MYFQVNSNVYMQFCCSELIYNYNGASSTKGNVGVLEMSNCMTRGHDDVKFYFRGRHTAKLREEMQGAWAEHWGKDDQA